LRELASGTHDGAVVRRLLAIALILDGHSRAEAARLNGMDRQTLRDWVHRYNEEGVAGLHSRVSPGRPGALNGAQMEALRGMVLEGPDPERDAVVRWRCADLRGCDRHPLVGGTARAVGRQAAASARHDPPAATAASPEEGYRGAGGF
jgi:transposase